MDRCGRQHARAHTFQLDSRVRSNGGRASETQSRNAGLVKLMLPTTKQRSTWQLDQQAIPHAAIPDSTNHFSLVSTLWESEFDLARSIEGFQLFGGEFQIQTGEIVPEL
jgi:hypothetical protein